MKVSLSTSCAAKQIQSSRRLLHHLPDRLSSLQVWRSQANLVVFSCQCLVRTQNEAAKYPSGRPATADRRFVQDRVLLQAKHANRKAIRELTYAQCCNELLPEHESTLLGAGFRKPNFLRISAKYFFVFFFWHFLNMYECIAQGQSAHHNFSSPSAAAAVPAAHLVVGAHRCIA